jgi:steroid delta-isomerase-like uncharacterized protein
MSEQNKAFVRNLLEEVINRRNLDIIDELVSPDYVGHASNPMMSTREGHKQFVMALHRAFPDIEMKVEDQVAEGDKVVTRWTARGTHKGEFMGIPATGKRGMTTGTDIDRIVNGKLVECWSNWDEMGLMQQLGVIPEPQRAA